MNIQYMQKFQNCLTLLLECRSIAENAGRPDWRDVLQGKDNKDNRSGMTTYGTTKLFNIMIAKELYRRLKVC